MYVFVQMLELINDNYFFANALLRFNALKEFDLFLSTNEKQVK